MATDHFETHFYQANRVDWNFNVLFRNQPDVDRMVREYAPLVTHAGLHDPIPTNWLHCTILRVGFVTDFTEGEMLEVVRRLRPMLGALELPEFAFDSWWLWSGNVVLHLTPDGQFSRIYDAVIDAMVQVVGKERTLLSPHGTFIPHVGLAYTRTHDRESEIHCHLAGTPVVSASFSATSLSLLRQWPAEGHYEWEMVEEIKIGGRARRHGLARE
jgi:2'-5' RNA ligase